MKKRILCYGDSNTWGYDGTTDTRFPEGVRWTSRLQEQLGDDFIIIEEGLCCRTTVFDDPLVEGVNGLTYLSPCLSTHAPLDYMILMLGTNDCKQRFCATPKNIAEGLKRLILKAQQAPVWRDAPNILVIAPAPIRKECESAPIGRDMGSCYAVSEKLADEYRLVAEELHCDFLDAAPFITLNQVDYLHIDKASHTKLADVLYDFLTSKDRG